MKKIVTLAVVFLFILSCSTVPITGRKRVNLVSDAQILPASFAQYEGFLKVFQLFAVHSGDWYRFLFLSLSGNKTD